jgi:hypothetical protein
MTTEPLGAVAARDAAAVRRARRAATILDDAFKIPGTDFGVGLSPLVSVVPVSGDVVSLVLSLYVVAEAVRVGVPKATLARMVGYVVADFLVGLVPLVGTLGTAAIRANLRNVRHLERHVDARRA